MAKEPEDKLIDVIRDSEMKACSAHECTGLIPSALTEDGEISAYEELYPFMPSEKDGIREE